MVLVSSAKCNIDLPFYRRSDAAAYSEECYRAKFGADGWNFFYNQSIHYTERSNDSCPFAGDTCALGRHSALNLDTGLIDAKVIGINSGKKYQFRRTSSCAPLRPDENFLTVTRDGHGLGQDDMHFNLYGRPKQLRKSLKTGPINTLFFFYYFLVRCAGTNSQMALVPHIILPNIYQS